MWPKQACGIMLFSLVISTIMNSAKGLVEISPSVVAPVCQAGDRLELTCTTSGRSHSWQLIENPGSGAATSLRRVSSIGSTGVEEDPMVINSVMFTFSRLSGPGSLPLMSKMTVSGVSQSLNGSQVNCVESEEESAMATILIIGGTPPAKLTIEPLSQQFMSSRVVVILEWTLSNTLGRYQQLLLPNASVSVVSSPEMEIFMFIRSTSIQVTLSYNILYNVNVTQPGICGQPSQTASIKLNYTKCYNPERLITTDVITEGFEDPALEGGNITFSCRDGLMLIGPNSAICTRNGEWEPDPREANCTAVDRETAVMDPNGTSTLNPANPLNPTSSCGDPPSMCPNTDLLDPTISTLRAALISVVCLSILTSAVMFVVGVVCGHYISLRWRVSTAGKQRKEQESSATNEDLELKENVAYITLHPK